MKDDTISRQAAIEHLKKRLYETGLNSTAEHPYYEEIADNMVDIWMNEVPSAQQERKWTPCSEGLPEVDELVLVTDDSGGIKTVDVDRCGQYECSKKRFWYYTQNVTAWMPRPKPYEGEK